MNELEYKNRIYLEYTNAQFERLSDKDRRKYHKLFLAYFKDNWDFFKKEDINGVLIFNRAVEQLNIKLKNPKT